LPLVHRAIRDAAINLVPPRQQPLFPGSQEMHFQFDSVCVTGIELRLGDPKKVLSHFEVPLCEERAREAT
jgi:hypothetical protein